MDTFRALCMHSIFVLILLISAGCSSGGGGGSKLLSSDDIPVDIRADINRDGVVEFGNAADNAGEDTWDESSGAVFLANMDDDESAYSTTGTDAQLAGYHDAADTIVNGDDDLLDLARLKLAAWPAAPDTSTGDITINAEAAGFVRIFKKDTNGNFIHLPLPGSVTLQEIQEGAELGIEATDIVRDDTVWDGFVTVTYTIDTISDEAIPISASDSVLLRVSPVIFSHSLGEAETIFATLFASQDSLDFRTDLGTAITSAGTANPLEEITGYADQWAGDFFKPAYMSMPAVGGQHVVRFYFRSSNYTGTLRNAGRYVYTDLRGPDAAAGVQYDPAHTDAMDTLNSFSNLVVIPPYSYNGSSYPHGRILRGGVPSTFYPDESFDLLLAAQGIDNTNTQGMQDILYADTSDFLIAHISELVSFVPSAAGTHGWVMLVADPAEAWDILTTENSGGHGTAVMFTGMEWSGSVSAEITIAGILGDTDLANANSWAVAEIDTIITLIKAETGITDADIIKVPALFHEQSSYLISYMPQLAAGISLSSTDYIAPDPHGAVVDTADIFKSDFDAKMSALGITVHYVENWNLYHRLEGTLINGANVQRTVSDTDKWWESGL